MSLEDEISKAIGAHGLWKIRLRKSIDSGKADGNPVEVAKDNVCAFGQWLHGASIPPATRMSPDYATVRRLHADFHKCAAKVLECVNTGHKAEADALMHGQYTKVSSDLTAAMMKWRSAAA